MRGPAMAPLSVERGDQQHQQQAEMWRQQFDSSVSAVSFGFVATAILISMFLVMAVFERFLRTRSPFLFSVGGGRRGRWMGSSAGGGPRGRWMGSSADPDERRRNFAGKLDHPSPKMSIYAKGVSVLMPGNDIPTFIAHPAPAPAPAPAPCPPERISWPSHQQSPIGGSTSISS